jgi:ribosome recycling factor
MVDSIISEATQRMEKAIAAFKNELNKLRSGRAHPSLLEHVTVDYYGNETPIHQVANITVEDPRTLGITPWEKNLVPAIEKAIMKADLGLNPATSGSIIRVPLPAMTEDRRKEMIKLVRQEAEIARVSVRNARRDANASVKDLLKAKDISEDDERRAEERIQKLTDKFVKEVDDILAKKELDLMEV